MKLSTILIIVISLVALLSSCERQSGRREANTYSAITYQVTDSTTNTIVFSDYQELSRFRATLDSTKTWSKTYSRTTMEGLQRQGLVAINEFR